MATFKETAQECLGAKLTCAKFEEVGIPDTPDYIPYADKDLNEMKFPDLDEEVTPEVGDEYVHAFTMLSQGNQMMQGMVHASKQDLDGNPIGSQLDNWILDTHLYDVEFLGGNANAIVQALYTQYDIDGNEYLLLKCFAHGHQHRQTEAHP